MKLVMIIYSGADRRLVPTLLEHHDVGGYTELPPAHGAGSTGRREATRAWPGDASIYFSILPAARVDDLTAALQARAGALPVTERLHAAVLPLETFF
jgi:hypothetical protein